MILFHAYKLTLNVSNDLNFHQAMFISICLQEIIPGQDPHRLGPAICTIFSHLFRALHLPARSQKTISTAGWLPFIPLHLC